MADLGAKRRRGGGAWACGAVSRSGAEAGTGAPPAGRVWRILGACQAPSRAAPPAGRTRGCGQRVCAHPRAGLGTVDLLNSQGSPGNGEGFALKQESDCLHSTAYHLIRKICV